MVKALIAVAMFMLGLVAGVPSAVACTGHLIFYPNQTAPASLFVASNERCAIRLGGTDEMAINGTRVIKPPSHGRTVLLGTGIGYVSSPGYVGDDFFIYQFYGTDQFNKPATATLEVTVKVSPAPRRSKTGNRR